jgi:hypothetical protein
MARRVITEAMPALKTEAIFEIQQLAAGGALK